MPDSNGLPTERDVLKKLSVTLRRDIPADVKAEIRNVLKSVLADFQAPPGPEETGGTGRRFVPITETRLYDGNGQNVLRVDDIVPDTDFTVDAFTLNLSDVILSAAPNGLGHDTLVRPQTPLQSQFNPVYGTRRIFPTGTQNIAITATWGFAATAPWNVWEAIRCEAARRLIVAGFIDIVGAGEQITIGSFTVNTAAGVSIWAQSSPVGVFETLYNDAKKTYRMEQRPSLARQEVRRMW